MIFLILLLIAPLAYSAPADSSLENDTPAFRQPKLSQHQQSLPPEQAPQDQKPKHHAPLRRQSVQTKFSETDLAKAAVHQAPTDVSIEETNKAVLPKARPIPEEERKQHAEIIEAILGIMSSS